MENSLRALLGSGNLELTGRFPGNKIVQCVKNNHLLPVRYSITRGSGQQGISAYQRFYPARFKDVSNSLTISFFHAFAGSDSTSFFFKKSKINFFRSWQSSKDLDELTATPQNFAKNLTFKRVGVALMASYGAQISNLT